MKGKGILLWGNALTINKITNLCAGLDDHKAVSGDLEGSYGQLIKMGFDIIQTDWSYLLSNYIKNNFKKLIEKENLIIPNTVVFVGYKPNKEIISILNTGAKLLLVDVPNIDYNPMINGGIVFDMNFLTSYYNKKILLVDYDFKIGESFLSSIKSRLSNQIEIDYFKVSDLNEIFNLFDSRMKLYDYSLILTIDRKLQSKIQDVRKWLGYSELNNLFSFESKQIIPVKNNFLELDYKLAAKKIVEMIVGKNYQFLELDFEQRIEKTTNKYSEEQKTVKLLTINSPTTKVLEFIASVFEKETNIKIDIEVLSTSEYDLSLLKNKEFRSKYDLIRLDMALFPDIGEVLFYDLSNLDNSEELYQYFNSQLLKEYMFINNRWLGVPLDVSVQLLFYRKDLFNDKLIQREYLEKYKNKLQIPRTFKEFDRISEFFTKSFTPNSPTEYGHSVAMKAPLVAACDFLPRYRELVKQNVENPYKIALEQYSASILHSDQNSDKWWKDIVNDFVDGKTAMMTVFSNYATQLNKRMNSSFEFGVARVPGENPLIGGGTIGIVKESDMKVEAKLFSEWIYSEEVSKIIVALGGMIFSEKVISNQDLIDMYPWISHVVKSLEFGKRQMWNNRKYSVKDEKTLGNRLLNDLK